MTRYKSTETNLNDYYCLLPNTNSCKLSVPIAIVYQKNAKKVVQLKAAQIAVWDFIRDSYCTSVFWSCCLNVR